jgi:hypothetical protein
MPKWKSSRSDLINQWRVTGGGATRSEALAAACESEVARNRNRRRNSQDSRAKEWREVCFAVEESASPSNGWNLQSARESSVATCVKQRERENVWLWDGRTRARQGVVRVCARFELGSLRAV